MANVFAGSGAEFGNLSERQFETSLISLVKFLPCLYDTSNPNYNNMQQNKIAWFKLSNTLKKSVTDCINKWYAMQQIFLFLNKRLQEQETMSPITWPHYYAMLRLQPNLNVTYFDLVQEKPPFLYSKPVNVQKETLVNEMAIHREVLLRRDISVEQKQKIWLQIAKKLNSIVNGVNMPVIKWQKYWCDLKQSTLDIRLKQNRAKVSAEGKYQNELQYHLISSELQCISHGLPIAVIAEIPKYSDEDLRILQFCGVRGSDHLSKINTALSDATEIGCDLDKIVMKCGRCNHIIQAPVNQKYCNACGLLPKTFCDICLRIYQSDLTVYEVKKWSMDAKNLLPPHLSSFASISACEICADDLKRNAGANWRACRICETYNHPLDNLFSSGNEVLRKAFMDATNNTFKETDGLPGYICKVCKVQMQQFNNFYLKFNRVQTRLNDIHNEYFIGVPGIILTKHTQAGCDSLNLPANRVPILKSNSNTSLGSGNNEEIKQPPVVVQTIQHFTIPSPTSHIPMVKINKNVQIKHIGTPAAESSFITKTINRINAPQTVPGPVGNTVKNDKVVTSQGLQTLQLVQGVPVITKQSSSGQIVVNGTVNKQVFKPILPKPTPGKLPTKPNNSALSNKTAVVIKSLNTKAPVSLNLRNEIKLPTERPSIPRMGAPVALPTEKPSTPKMGAPVTSTISGILAQHKWNGPIPSAITIKTQSGTTTLCPTRNVKGIAVTSATSSVASVNNGNAPRKIVGPDRQIVDPLSSSVVLQIPDMMDDMMDPNSPPAFCIPKSGSQIQAKTFTATPGNLSTIQAPQNTVTLPENTPPIVDVSQIKTERIEEDEPTDEQLVEKNNSMINNISSSCPESCPSSGEALEPSQQPLGKRSEKPTTDAGVKKPQQNLSQQPQPPLTGNKRPRKYWGAVDEFHIPSKIANLTQPPNEMCSQISIKQEGVDPDEENINNDDEPTNNEVNINMFYPDSFELGNVSLDADVTSVLKDMIAHHQTSTDSETYQFSNPLFNKPSDEKPASSTNGESKTNSESTAQREGTSKDASKTNKETETCSGSKSCNADVNFQPKAQAVKINVESKIQPGHRPNGSNAQHEHKASGNSKAFDDANTQRELKTKDESKRKNDYSASDVPKENKKNKLKLTNSKKFPVKKLLVKLKRSKKLQSLQLRRIKSDGVPRSCTIARRKSMRLKKSIF